MLLSDGNFLIGLRNLNVGPNGGRNGSGFWKTKDINLFADLRTSTGLTLTAATNPLVAALETNALGVQWASSDSTKAAFNFVVPFDYDEASDVLVLSMLINSAGNTDAPTMGANVYNKRAGTALSADLAPSASAAIPTSGTETTAMAERTIIISGAGLKANDALTVNLAPGAHTTDAVDLYAMSIRYYSTLCAYESALR